QRVIGYSLPTGQEPQLTAIGRGMEEAIKQLELNWEVDIQDAQLSADTQVAGLDTLITKRVDAIASWTLDPGAADAVYQRAKSAGIALIGINSESQFFDSMIQTET